MFRIHFKNPLFSTLLFAVLLFACTQQSPLTPSSTGHSSLSASITFAEEGIAVASFDSLLLSITGQNIDPINVSLLLEGAQAKTQIKVPANVGLLATVSAYKDSQLVMQGSDSVSVEKGKTRALAIHLNFVVPTLILSKPHSTVDNGDTLTLYLAARNVSNLATIGARIQFDPGKLQVAELGRQDSLLMSNGGTVNQLLFTNDNANGLLDMVLGVFPSISAVSGHGNIGRIVFTAIDTGVTDLAIRIDNDKDSNYALFDQNADLMYAMGIGARVTIQ